MSQRIWNVLFLCTGNSARSILGEAILRREGGGRLQSFSAGSHPEGDVHPLALSVLASLGYETGGLRSKAWDEFARPDAPRIDFVFTVCDNAAGESCPIWPGHPMTAHWGIEDPAAVRGTETEKEAAFFNAAELMKNRILAFTQLPLETIDHGALRSALNNIGALDGATRCKPEVA